MRDITNDKLIRFAGALDEDFKIQLTEMVRKVIREQLEDEDIDYEVLSDAILDAALDGITPSNNLNRTLRQWDFPRIECITEKLV